MSRSQTYSNYLHLDRLLELQTLKSDGPEHDEMLFIIIHQVYELWFKQVLHEVDYLRDRMDSSDSPAVLATLKRVLTILKTLVGQIDILETMTPMDFRSFRDRLESASGFESFQFRELEMALGKKDAGVIERFPAVAQGRTNLQRRLGERSIWTAFLDFAHRGGHPIPDEMLQRDPRLPTAESDAVQKCLVGIYRDDQAVAQVCERLVDLDEGIQEWRYRHVTMVQRTIGTKHGTGGSSGADYLRTTLFRPLFPDLWAIRALL